MLRYDLATFAVDAQSDLMVPQTMPKTGIRTSGTPDLRLPSTVTVDGYDPST